MNAVPIGAAAGCLIAAPCSDFLGRKISMILNGFLFLLGCTLQEFANLPVFYAGRVLAGVAIGGMSMLAPQYLAENSPRSIRE